MPKRANVKRFDSPAVQGEDSHVTLRRFTWGEAKALDKEANALSADSTAVVRAQVVIEAIISHLVEWNWVDDSGTLMPLPKTEKDFESLNDLEFTFLSECVNDLTSVKKEESKN